MSDLANFTSDGVGVPTGPEMIYRESLKGGVFRIQKCRSCARHTFYPRTACVHCGAFDMDWIVPSGNGVVYSSSVVRRKPEAGGDLSIALIDLAEGVRMMSRVDGVPPEQVNIGMAVTARIISENEQPLVVFSPAKEVV